MTKAATPSMAGGPDAVVKQSVNGPPSCHADIFIKTSLSSNTLSRIREPHDAAEIVGGIVGERVPADLLRRDAVYLLP